MTSVTDEVPVWMKRLATYPATVTPDNAALSQSAGSGETTRQAAVLILISGRRDSDAESADQPPSDATLLLTQRALTLRQHGGQVAFPGGAHDDSDADLIETALREAAEETALEAAGVDVVAAWPKVFVPPSGFDVTPVIGYWREPSEVRVVNTSEAARVQAVPLAELIDPANRFVVRHPWGYRGPAFLAQGMLVWGFTGAVLSGLLAIAGWEKSWDTNDVRDLETELAATGQPDLLPKLPLPAIPIPPEQDVEFRYIDVPMLRDEDE